MPESSDDGISGNGIDNIDDSETIEKMKVLAVDSDDFEEDEDITEIESTTSQTISFTDPIDDKGLVNEPKDVTAGVAEISNDIGTSAISDDVMKIDESMDQEHAKITDAESIVVHKESSVKSANDDVTNNAAVALAAVAAAATANNKSPAEAGREARDLAQSFIRTAVNVDTTSNKEFITVSLNAVKVHLRQRALETGSALTDRLCQGDNDAFLQYLLLLEYFRCVDDSPDQYADDSFDSHDKNLKNNVEHLEDESDKAGLACEKLEALLKRIESAYDCLVGMLPSRLIPTSKVKSSSPQPKNSELLEESDVDETDDVDRHQYIPDLLPPCRNLQGDATVAFFRACLGHTMENQVKKHGVSNAERSNRLSSLLSTTSTTTKVSDDTQTISSKDVSTPNAVTDEMAPASPSRQASGSVFSSMFKRSVTKPAKQNDVSNSSSLVSSLGGSGISGVFRKKKIVKASDGDDNVNLSNKESEHINGGDDGAGLGLLPGEYIVRIEREMLGLTVENVLERTVVRTVVPGGSAKKAGAKVGSLIVKVGNIDTKNLTHFETIDELRQSNRPLQLVMRQISEDALRSAREEMGRLIRGSGFGQILDSYDMHNFNTFSNEVVVSSEADTGDADNQADNTKSVRPLIAADLRIDAYTSILRRRFAETASQPRNKKEETVARIGEKLVWILTLFVVGLEREASFWKRQSIGNLSSTNRINQQHSERDYLDAAKSVSKLLFNYTRKLIDPKSLKNQKARSSTFHSLTSKVSTPPPPPPPVRGVRGTRKHMGVSGYSGEDESSIPNEKPLFQIGDLLQRTRTFLADTSSPPAALLRGEVIGFLCDVLDIDTEMELSEEEAASATAGASASAINDLGSAGSLLKLMILNCNVVHNSSVESIMNGIEVSVSDSEEETTKRLYNRDEGNDFEGKGVYSGNRFLAVVHRLAASRSTSARVTACSLGPVLWGHLDFPHQLQLRGVITRALHDVEVIVRKSTATVLHEIAELVFDKRSVPWLVLMCERAMTDPEAQLRSAAMTLTWHLGENLPNAFLGDASQGSRYLRRLPSRDDPLFADVYLLQCKLFPVATRLAEDRSPSVRLAVAAQCDRLCNALGDHWSSVIIDVLHGMLTDTDERVRCEAVSCVPRISEIVLLSAPPGKAAVSETSILESLIPASIKLQKDMSISVRVSLATTAGELLTLLVAMQRRTSDSLSLSNHEMFLHNGVSDKRFEADSGKRYKSHVDDRLIPLVQQLLNDADPEVTSAALRAVTNATRSSVQQSRTRHMSTASEDDSSFSSFQSHTSSREKPVFLPVLSENQVLRLLPTLTELSDSKQWRVRQSAVEIVPALLGCTHKIETRSEISKLCVRLMGDQVDAVRKTAAECLCMGGSSLGSHGEDAGAEWISSIVIPSIRRCSTDALAKQRLLSLKMIEVILLNGVCPPKWYSNQDSLIESPMRELVTIALSLTNDPIANVRLNVGRVLESVLHVLDEQEVSYIKDVLNLQLQSERKRDGGGDRDVIYFADLCLSKAKNLAIDRSTTINSQDSL